MGDFVWTDEAQAFLEEMARDGATGLKISKALGISRSAVLGRCHRTGVRLGADRESVVPEAMRLLALAAYFAGCTCKRAALEAGVDGCTLRRWIKSEPALVARAKQIALAAGGVVERTETGHRINAQTGKQYRGFAAMDRSQRRAIQMKGVAARRKIYGRAVGGGFA